MRFPHEAGHGANAGLHLARELLEDIKKKHPAITYAGLKSWAFVIFLFNYVISFKKKTSTPLLE